MPRGVSDEAHVDKCGCLDHQSVELMRSGCPEDAAFYWGTIISALRQRVETLEGFLALSFAGRSGPDEIEIWKHCGISHQKGVECIACRALGIHPADLPRDSNLDGFDS